jgi:hypothetical protein
MQIIGHHVFIAMCYSDNDFVRHYPLFGFGLPIIGVQIMELEISWPDDSMEPIGEWPEAGDMASTQCIATAGCTMCFIMFPPALHLSMMLFSIVLNAIPQI